MLDKQVLVLAISIMFSISFVALAYAEDAAPPAPAPEPTPPAPETPVIAPEPTPAPAPETPTPAPSPEPTPVPCPASPPPIDCGTNARGVDDFDSRGCMTGHHCETTIGGGTGGGAGPATSSGGGGCPPVPPGVQCQTGVIDDFDSNGCLVGRHCRTEAEMPGGAAGGQAQQPMSRQCPLENTCPDGTRPCYMVDNRCECKACPPPQGCTEEKDPQTGFVKVNCQGTTTEKRCPDIPADEEQRCRDKGGNPFKRDGAGGCPFIECSFGAVNQNMFAQNRTCPSEQNIQQVKEQCKDGNFVVMDDMGCKVGVCRGTSQQQLRQECGMVSGPERIGIENDCKAKGMGTVSSFDESGCQNIKCGNPNECRTNLPDEAYNKCKDQGGEMVVKNDNMGCIVFQQCVMKGDDSQVYYEEIDKMPEMTDMLSMAFKLEELKIQFDKLRLKTEDVARYYESTGSGEAERFKRVAGMFNSIKDKVDEIKTKFRDRLETISKEDISEIKHDINYIKEKMLKDVLYLMLSSSDEVKGITSKSETDCGSDGRCFDEALRVCKQVAFNPPESGASIRSIVKIMGMEGTNCLINILAPSAPGGSMSMDCKYPNYAMGLKGPEDILPYCTGALADMMKTYGTAPSQPAPIPSQPTTTAPQPTNASTGSPAACSGCLNNGVCDPGECRDCPDCIGGGA